MGIDTLCTRLPGGSSNDQGLCFPMSGGCGRTALVAGVLKASGEHAMVLQSAFAPDEALAQADIGETYGRGVHDADPNKSGGIWHSRGVRLF